MNRSSLVIPLSVTLPLAMLVIGGCEKKPASPSTPAPATHSHDDGHDHGPNGEHKDGDHGHSEKRIALGEQSIGGFTVTAGREEGTLAAGKSPAFDLTVAPAAGGTAKVASVRFWVGTQDAKGSVKAKAELEDPKNPNGWHAHAELPNPLPQGSKLWVEVEDDKGVKTVGSFDLKA